MIILQDKTIKIEHFDVLPSTNDYALSLQTDRKTVILADTQTNGKGRIGRTFFSPDKSGLYLSFLFFPRLSWEKCQYYTPAAAVCAARTIEKISGKKTVIKWVNDILVDQKKVCGILTEAKTDSGLLSKVVVGVGINLFPPKNGFPPEIAQKADSLFEKEIPEIREKIASSFIDEFCTFLQEPESCLPDYQSRLGFIGKTAFIHEKAATILGVDDRCRLLVRYENGMEEAVDSGEVSIKELY